MMTLVHVQRSTLPDHIIAHTTQNHEQRPIGPIALQRQSTSISPGTSGAARYLLPARSRCTRLAPPAVRLAEIAGVSCASPQQALAWLRNADELVIYVTKVGLTPMPAIVCATRINAIVPACRIRSARWWPANKRT